MVEIVGNVESKQVIIAIVIFLTSYAVIVSEKINRSIIALCGALLMVIFGIVDLHDAYTEHIHWATIFLLLGMMILVGITNKSGIFQYIAVKTAQSANGDPVKILVRLALLTAVGSAFIDNVTTVLLITPITIAIARILHISSFPFLITEILVCNIGGAATLVGDPPNIMIGVAADISFNDFLLHITPIIVIIMLITVAYLKYFFGKQLHVQEQYVRQLMDIDAREYIRDTTLAKKSLFVFALTLLGFVLHQFLHLEPAVVALSGATLLMLIGVKDSELEEVFHSVEWVTIFFFAGLFVLVGGLVEVGVISRAAAWMIEVTGGDMVFTSLVLLWGAGFASAFVDNIPLVATMIPMIQDMSIQLALPQVETATLWWSLALGACLGGNGTLIASSANLVVASIAVREGEPISFTDFLKVSIPVTLISLALASVYVYVVFVKLGFA
ncbi:ArsB/NhaD family transporter [Desulfitobacterium chlororespirans]|uniref:Possible tyrosine transporter P-protein (TC 2.A.45.2.1) n=1 Tax=Desulfitobacterium chlororespirans DSM 11544 TaxID=1121395 RepID=A0A1M7T504_9FIRM|nr:ArsB/NhaD family transporter [Desulfitobacterium chlororespirans]SHN65771.1 possible tyrosine transporter P-protein (TC 2.A.45.2.1) [Desulfitobacterium chlororespirans DSM 11544]